MRTSRSPVSRSAAGAPLPAGAPSPSDVISHSAIRVLLVDDDPIVVGALAGTVGSEEGIEIVATATDGAAAVDSAARHYPDVALMDIRMPRMTGIEAAARMTSGLRPPKVVLMTSLDHDPELLSRAIEAGVVGFLLKGGEMGDYARAVREAAQDHSFFSPEAARGMIALVGQSSGEDHRRVAREKFALLTETEAQVARRVRDGESGPDIARGMHISQSTVKTHLRSIGIKYGLDSSNQVPIAVLTERALG
ncbi:response regulator transcription factor [Brevibacterium litoralis]|uniref:response regulator transcription factor n=1 Tax=Brevibacterium litoralis TaxID=3138935 RepID=UPI0032ECFA88